MTRSRRAAARLRAYAGTLWADGRGWVLLLVAAGWALSIGVRFVFPAVVPFVRAEFGVGLATTGLLLTCLWGAYAAGHVPGGLLGDRLGEGRTLLASTLLATGAVVAVAAAPAVWLLFAATMAFGLATALYGPTRFTVLTDLYPDNSGSAVGATMAAGNVGNTLLPVVATVLAGAVSWRLGIVVFAPLFAAVAVGLWLVVPRRTSAPGGQALSLSWATVRDLRRALETGSIPVVVGVQVALSFLIQGFASFYPIYLVTVKALSPGTAATLFGGFFALGAVVQPVSGRLADRLGLRRTLLGFLAGALVAVWTLPFVSGLVALALVTALFASWNGTIVGTQTYIAETLPERVQGTGFGLLKAGWMLLGATAPLLVGLIADAGLFDEAFLLLGAVGTTGFALAALALPAAPNG